MPPRSPRSPRPSAPAPTTRSTSARARRCSRRRCRTSGGATATSSSRPRSRPACFRASPAARSPRSPARPATGSARARSRSRTLLHADEAFTSSAVREIMPVIAVDGRELPRGDGRPEAPGAPRAGRPTTTLWRWPTKAEKVRLGGMALANGVLVHGPTAWACAVRTDDGEREDRFRAQAARRLARDDAAPARPGAARRGLRGAPAGQAGAARGEDAVRGPHRVHARWPAPRSPSRSLRRTPAQRDGAGAHRRAARDRPGRAHRAQRLARRLPRRRAHRDRQLRAGPADREGARALRLPSRRPAASSPRPPATCSPRARRSELRPAARLAASLGAVAAATEIFGWMTRHPDRRLARALARPGPRAPASALDRRAERGPARGRRGGARGLPRARRRLA